MKLAAWIQSPFLTPSVNSFFSQSAFYESRTMPKTFCILPLCCFRWVIIEVQGCPTTLHLFFASQDSSPPLQEGMKQSETNSEPKSPWWRMRRSSPARMRKSEMKIMKSKGFIYKVVDIKNSCQVTECTISRGNLTEFPNMATTFHSCLKG